MKISIAMATYNGEKYILEQLESFVMQTRQPDELMITDDCSTDGTVNILKNFQNRVFMGYKKSPCRVLPSTESTSALLIIFLSNSYSATSERVT